MIIAHYADNQNGLPEELALILQNPSNTIHSIHHYPEWKA